MTGTVNILGTLKKAKMRHWLETIYWLIFTVFGSGLPIYGGWFLLALWSIKVGFVDFCKDGEFALYSAAIIGSTLHLISKGGYKNLFVNMRCFVIISFVLLVLATLMFAAATAASINDDNITGILNLKLLVVSSVIVLVFTVAVAFVANLIDSIIYSTDLPDIEKQRMKKLSEDFEKTGDENE